MNGRRLGAQAPLESRPQPTDPGRLPITEVSLPGPVSASSYRSQFSGLSTEDQRYDGAPPGAALPLASALKRARRVNCASLAHDQNPLKDQKKRPTLVTALKRATIVGLYLLFVRRRPPAGSPHF